MSSRSRQQLEDWLRTIETRGKVLDIGGSQNPISGKRVKTWGASSYVVMDLPHPHEVKKDADISFDIQESLNKFDGQCAYYENQFDQVFCIEVAEYWHDPMTALKNINHFMRFGGELFISFHWLYGLHPPKGEDCLRYSLYAVDKMLEKAGFEIDTVTVKTITEEGADLITSFYREEGMRVTRDDRSLFDEGYLVKAIKV